MSMLLMVKAMNIKVGNPLRKLVLIKLADNANDKGECWPSYQHIADQCEISRSTVRKHIKDLSDSGLLKIQHRAGVKGNSSNLYHLTLQGMPSDDTGMPSDDTTPMPSDDTRTSHSFEPVNESVNETSLSFCNDSVKSVIDKMNSILNSKYKSSTKSHAQNINARLQDGHAIDDLIIVVKHKYQEWKDDPKMAQYLRPQTLFQAGKFDGYLMAAKTKPVAKQSVFNTQTQNYGDDKL